MNSQEFDKAAGELFKLIDKTIKEDNADPRFQGDQQILRAIVMLGVEFVSDVKRIENHVETIGKGLCALVDLQAHQYQNGSVVFSEPLAGGISERSSIASFIADVRSRMSSCKIDHNKTILNIFDDCVLKELENRYGQEAKIDEEALNQAATEAAAEEFSKIFGGEQKDPD